MSIIKEVRLVAGLKSYELARRLGMCASRYSYIERMILAPSDDELDRLAAVLAVAIFEAEKRLQHIKGRLI